MVISYLKNKGGRCENHRGTEPGPWVQASLALEVWEPTDWPSKTAELSVSQRQVSSTWNSCASVCTAAVGSLGDTEQQLAVTSNHPPPSNHYYSSSIVLPLVSTQTFFCTVEGILETQLLGPAFFT